MKPEVSLFGDQRLSQSDALDLTIKSLNTYGPLYKHWAVAFSGGKDSTATVTTIAHLLDTGQVERPESLTVLYADTRMELPPLHNAAMAILERLRVKGFDTRVVLPEVDRRFYVYMFGKGVPPSHSGFRWCTGALKIDPMVNALRSLRDLRAEKFLMLTGVRLGESAARDNRIVLSCSKNGTECGQGYYQRDIPSAVADTLAPIVHWRICHVWDWLVQAETEHGWPTFAVAETYGMDHEGSSHEIGARTGCVGCPVAHADTALETVLKKPRWSYLEPLKRLRQVYAELSRPSNRLRRSANTYGPLVMQAREWGIEQILEIEQEVNRRARESGRPEISLINAEELSRIRGLIAAKTWPDGWTGEERRGTALDEVASESGELVAIEWMHGGGRQATLAIELLEEV